MAASREPTPDETTARDTTVDSGGVAIAVRDHGGGGPPVVLLHGGGGNLLAWEQVAPRLTGSNRVLAVDLRGHGHSGDGPWEWEAVLDDLEAVSEHFRLDTPAVVGHSLGGMLAGMWARRNPDCPAAVSLDGHRSAVTHEPNYAGMPPERLRQDLERLRAMFTAQAEMMSRPLTAEQVEALLQQQRALAAAHGADAHAVLEATRRGLTTRDGQTWMRPNAEITATLQTAPEFADSLPIFAQVTAPFLIVVAARNLPGLPEDLRELMDAFRAGLRRDLAALTTQHPNLHVQELDASHGMLQEHPARIAALITAFLSEHHAARAHADAAPPRHAPPTPRT